MVYTSFEEEKFRAQVDKALKTVLTILDTTRTPRYAEEQDHVYEDKYALADIMTNTAVASYINVLERFGLDDSKLRHLCQVVHQDKRSVTLRFAMEDSCSFLKEKDVKVTTHGEVEHVVEATETTVGSILGLNPPQKETTVRSKVSKKVREYHWTVGLSYKLLCFVGNDPDKDPMVLQSHSSSTVIITSGIKTAPLPERTIHPFLDVNLTWLLHQISSEKQVCGFQIDRSKEKCFTPRRNEDIDKAFDFFTEVDKWSSLCFKHFRTHVEDQILNKHDPADFTGTQTPSLRSVHADGVLCPILPLFEEPRHLAGTATREEHSKSLVALTSNNAGEASPVLSVGDIDKFLNEQIRQLDEAKESLTKSFPTSDDKIVTVAEATLVLLWHHTNYLSFNYRAGIDYIEDMLRKQLIAAIGKIVNPQDFDDFIRFHGKKLFGSLYMPKPFCYAIRRPHHFPDGILSIESATDKMEPILTTVNFIEQGPSMFMPINAATSIEFTGHRFLHGWIQHKFESKSSTSSFNLTARARQFSSFLVMVGTISGPTEFTPKDAIILQNKDEVIIPLLLNELPTVKEFKDAISSLSPEQQRFAKSFRGMQLESSVFGVCVVQLKPQLEVLLGLPPDALTKEIRLTQDLLSLFIDYQIPSDLLSFDGEPNAAVADKVAAVKEHVKAVLVVIEDAKKKQLEDIEKKAEMNVYERFAEYPGDGVVGAQFHTPVMPNFMTSTRSMPKSAASLRVTPSAAQTERALPQKMSKTRLPPESRLELQNAPPLSMEPIISQEGTAPSSSGKPVTSSNGLGDADQPITQVAPGTIDFTAIPKQLDAKFDVHDVDSALRATIIKADKSWKRMRQENLLTKARESMLRPEQIKSEKEKAFDLLDALSRSGSLPIACAELHVVVAVTHCFEKDVMGTVIKDNMNPIEKVEKTMLLMASTIHGVEPQALIENQVQTARLMQNFPALFILSQADEE